MQLLPEKKLGRGPRLADDAGHVWTWEEMLSMDSKLESGEASVMLTIEEICRTRDGGSGDAMPKYASLLVQAGWPPSAAVLKAEGLGRAVKTIYEKTVEGKVSVPVFGKP